MMYRYATGTMFVLTICVMAAWAQEASVLDFSSWLQRQSISVSRDAEIRQAVRDRIATVRAERGKLVSQVHRGRWQSERYNRSAQPWFVQLKENRDDGTITGHVTVVGSGLFSKGNISGKFDGSTVSGFVTDDSGIQLATFSGSVSPDSAMSGSYITSDGDVGSWGVDSD